MLLGARGYVKNLHMYVYALYNAAQLEAPKGCQLWNRSSICMTTIIPECSPSGRISSESRC